jgi:hypothetical protein
MKPFLLLAFTVVSVMSFAQQPPQPAGQAPGAVVKPAPPAAAPPLAAQPSTAELAELLRAQTAAIKSLSARIDSLDERIRKLEDGAR